LRASFSETVHAGGAPSAADQLRAFLAKAQKTGAVLVEPGVRKAAQGILDYWCAELAGLADAKAEDFVPLALMPPDISTLPALEQTAGASEQTTQRKEDQRVLIRLSGMARQWRNSGRQAGYLLTGEALEQARPFAEKDTDLMEFIEASEQAEYAKRRRKRNIAYGSMVGTVMLGCVATFFIWQFYALPLKSKSWIRQIAESTLSETQTNNLAWLATFQPWMPPYDLSGTPKLSNIRIPGLRLYAPNFSGGVKFSRVLWEKAELPSASFNQSVIFMEADATSSEGRGFNWYDITSWILRWSRGAPPDWTKIRWNEFSGAELKLAQFREAQIITTSFAGADLYRAVFDRALLCDVNFGNADLSNASFWGATIDDRTYGWLRKTAWWIAVGWNSDDFKKLLRPQNESQSDPQSPSVYPPTNAAEGRALRQALRTSERFHTDLEIPITQTGRGTFGRAVALNDMAWTLATWGIEGDDLTPNPAACNSSSLPKDALEAASQAICIVADLKNNGIRDIDYDNWFSNFRDTQAYILMQANRMAEARALYEKDLDRTEADGGMLFRYAIALYATGEEGAADAKFENAIRQKEYLPSTELQNLKQYIPIKVLGMAYDLMDRRYPAQKLNQTCPANPN
jgi:uncharacterized protein YjbI with pentapeptide repeats